MSERTLPFGLHWPGKSEARDRAHTPVRARLRAQQSESLHWSDTGHLVVEGDSLEALKALRPSLAGKVRLIFIDPPYNTGQSFMYRDQYADGVAAYRRRSGRAVPGRLGVDPHGETAGRHHAGWLDMMLPRLELARALLADNGALFVTIDDHEVHHLRMLLDEVFGREAFVASCAWQKVFAKKNKALISRSHDHVLIYARQAGSWERNLWPRSEGQLTAYRNPDHDPRGRWQSVAYSVPSEDGHRRAAYRYGIQTPAGGVVVPPAGRHWNGLPERTEALRADNRLWFGKTGDRRPRLKVFLSEVQGGIVPDTWWPHDRFGHNQEAKKELLSLLGGSEPFTTPKPTRLLRRIIEMATHPHERDLVLDFFAGSGTTAHALWQVNAKDGGNRRVVLVQLPEPTGDTTLPTIAALCRERLRRAAEAVEGPGDRGFRALKLVLPEAEGDQGQEEGVPSAERAPAMDAVLAAMVQEGVELSATMERAEISGLPVYWVDRQRLVVCPQVPHGGAEALVAGLVAWRDARPEATAPAVALVWPATCPEAEQRSLSARLMAAGFAGVRGVSSTTRAGVGGSGSMVPGSEED